MDAANRKIYMAVGGTPLSKSDFYEITDDIQQFQASSNGKLEGDYL